MLGIGRIELPVDADTTENCVASPILGALNLILDQAHVYTPSAHTSLADSSKLCCSSTALEHSFRKLHELDCFHWLPPV
jgi:hypothetical protein